MNPWIGSPEIAGGSRRDCRLKIMAELPNDGMKLVEVFFIPLSGKGPRQAKCFSNGKKEDALPDCKRPNNESSPEDASSYCSNLLGCVHDCSDERADGQD